MIILILVLAGTTYLLFPISSSDNAQLIRQNPNLSDILTEEQIEIVSLKDNSLIDGDIHGGIFIISGSINESPAYFYYKKVGDGYTQDYIKADGVIIYEDTINTGYINTKYEHKVTSEEWRDKYLHWLIIPNINKTTAVSTEIHVPENSIIKDFALDAE